MCNDQISWLICLPLFLYLEVNIFFLSVKAQSFGITSFKLVPHSRNVGFTLDFFSPSVILQNNLLQKLLYIWRCICHFLILDGSEIPYT